MTLFTLSAFVSNASAELTYDPYSQEPKTPEAYNAELVKKGDTLYYGLLNLPTLPLRASSWGIEKGLNWIEQTHFPQKVQWFWEDVLHENGLYPEMRFSPGDWGFGGGGHVELMELARLDERIPFLKLQGKGGATIAGDYDFGGSYELSQSGGMRFYHRGIFDYTHKENEYFFGLGPRTSDADGINYVLQTAQLKAQAGFHPISSIDLGGEFSYRHVTVQDTDEDDVANINDRYNITTLQGLDGGQIVTVGGYLAHDTRDYVDDPTKGGLRSLRANFNRDTRHDDNYFKYALELSQYLRLWSDRRIFAAHFMAEHVQDIDNSSIPFFDMARVGGYGFQPEGSATNRGYTYNRFFDKSSAVLNLEYRYNVWQYGNFGGDWVFFTDLGKVFGDLHEFGKGGLKVSYGTGLRLKAHRRVFFSIQLAKSNEGTEVYVKTKTPF